MRTDSTSLGRVSGNAPGETSARGARPVVRPRNWDEAQVTVSDAYFPHRVTPLTDAGCAGVKVRVLPVGPIRLTRIDWGTEVSVASSHPGAYALNIPLSGRIRSRCDGEEVSAGQGDATLYRPDLPAEITRWSADCEIVGVRFDKEFLDREVSRVLGRPDRRLPADIDLRTTAGRSWMRLLRTVSEQCASDSTLWCNPLVADQLAGTIATSLVLTVMPDEDAPAASRPRTVKRVMDSVHDDPARAWTVADMAEISGVGVRRLQEGFRDHVGMSPRDFVLDVRLDRIHADLTAGSVGQVSVTDVAVRWGITHTGRFAAAYRRKFGCCPSETLRG